MPYQSDNLQFDPGLAMRLLDVIVEQSSDNVVIADGHGLIRETSPKWSTIYGGGQREHLGRSVFELEREGTLTPSVTARVLEQRREAQVMQRTRTGRLVLARGYPVFDNRGAIVRVVSFSYDITDLHRLRREYETLQRAFYADARDSGARAEIIIDGITLRSEAMRNIYSLLQRVAKTDSNVLFLGESGVGKTAFAQQLHTLSGRSAGPFIEISCATLPENLFESELFGYAPGAFTGAQRGGKPGLIEETHGGTLFLDEVAEMPLSTQSKLLKVLQDRKIIRLGGTREKPVDFRLLCATNRDLEQMVEDGSFRLDLFYRLNVIPIAIPPLRYRREDLPALIDYFLQRVNARHGTAKRLDEETRGRLLRHDWPGNMRELENVLERLIVTSPGEVISLDRTLMGIPPFSHMPALAERSATSSAAGEPETLPQAVARLERALLLQAREQCASTYAMATRLGISQSTVVRKLQRYGL